MGQMQLVKIIIVVQLFYAFAITALVYNLPVGTQGFFETFNPPDASLNIVAQTNEIESSVRNSLDIPVVEIGALLFYSGNIVLDLLLNFIFAIPQMIGMLINGFTVLFTLDNQLVIYLNAFTYALTVAWYMIGLLQLLNSIRSGQGVL
jgi:hypothetical protein